MKILRRLGEIMKVYYAAGSMVPGVNQGYENGITCGFGEPPSKEPAKKSQIESIPKVNLKTPAFEPIKIKEPEKGYPDIGRDIFSLGIGTPDPQLKYFEELRQFRFHCLEPPKELDLESYILMLDLILP